MKSKKMLARVLAVLLLISLLAGYTPAPNVDAAEDHGSDAVVLADDNNVVTTGDDNDAPVTEGPNEGGTTEQPGEGGTTEQPGEGGTTEQPGEGGETPSTSVNVSVTVSDDVVVKADGKQITSGTFEVAPGETTLIMQLADAYKDDNAPDAYAFLVNGEKLSGNSYVVPENIADTEAPSITIAAFGIMKAKVDRADDWMKSKTLYVEAFGETTSVEFAGQTASVSDKQATFNLTTEQDEDGTDYTLTARAGDSAKLDSLKKVNVKKIDHTKPRGDDATVNPGPRGSRIATYSFVISEDLSGIDKSSFSVSGVYNSLLSTHSVPADQIGEIEYNEKTGEVKFVAASSVRYRGSYYQVEEYTVTVKDHAGNELVFNVISSAESDDHVSTRDDNEKPVIEKISVVPNNKDINWVGPNSVITVLAKDTAGKRAVAGLKALEVTNSVDKKEVFSKDFKKTQLHSGETDEQELKLNAGDENLFKAIADNGSGEYTFTVSDQTDNRSDSVTMTFQYDGDAPKISSATVETQERNVLATIVHAVTGGVLCHEKIKVNVELSEEELSGVVNANCTFEGQEAATPVAVVQNEDGSYAFTIDIPNPKSRVDIGTLSFTLTDCAGNTSEAATVKYVVDGSEKDAEFTTVGTNKNGQANPGNLVVYASYMDEGIEVAYPEEVPWTKQVNFRVAYEYPSMESQVPEGATIVASDSDIKKPTKSGQEIYRVTISGVTLSWSDGGNNNRSVELGYSKDQPTAVWDTVYGGEEQHIQFNGNLTFTAVPNIKVEKNTSIDNTPPASENNPNPQPDYVWGGWEDATPKVEDVKQPVPVKVQTYIDPADLFVNGKNESGNTVGWFNGNGAALKEAYIGAPKSAAPYTLSYAMTYTSNDGTIKDAPVYTENDKAKTETREYPEATPGNENDRISTQGDIIAYGKAGTYKLTASVKDAAGNTADEQFVCVKYDANAPLIHAVFKDEKVPSDKGDKYYNVNRTVTIYISDAGFVGDDISEAATDIDLKPRTGHDAVLKTNWYFEHGKSAYKDENGNDALYAGGRWVIEYSYGMQAGSARDGDDYELAITSKDVAGNESSTAKTGQYTGNGNTEIVKPTAYTGDGHEDLFTVDQTAPVVTVSFNNNAARNGKYFNAGRTATITVVEHNFDESRVTLETPGSSGRSGWTHNGDTHTMTVSYNSDAQNCSISINVVDKAGNVCPDAAVNYGNSVAVKDFVIDQTRPNVTYTGVDQSPYSDVCTPGFTSTDANLGNEFTYTLTRKTIRGEENVHDLPGGGSAASFSFSDIEHIRENDGIYTMTVTVTDLAGNVTTLEPVEFAVNRFGSVYTLSKDLENTVGKYLNKDGWAKASKGDLTITEFNPTELKDDAKLDVYRDGTLVKSYTGAELKKLMSGGNRGSVGLYEYVYKLPVDVFSEDGAYRVVVSSTDGSDHKSANDKFGAEVSFVIDTVAPEIVSITGLDKQTVNAKSQTVGYQILDTYGLDRVTIRVDGPDGEIFKEYISQAVLDSQNGKMESYQTMLPEGELDLTDDLKLAERNTPYHVVISVTDKAGNTSVADSGSIERSTEEGAYTPAFDFLDSVTVSTNFFVRFIHNTGALIGTGVGLAAIAGIIWLILAKRRKKEDEKAA